MILVLPFVLKLHGVFQLYFDSQYFHLPQTRLDEVGQEVGCCSEEVEVVDPTQPNWPRGAMIDYDTPLWSLKKIKKYQKKT